MPNIDELKRQFTLYDAADAKVEEIKLQLEAALSARSDVVRAILSANEGGKKLRRAGKELTIVQRSTTFFFRGGKKDDLVDV